MLETTPMTSTLLWRASSRLRKPCPNRGWLEAINTRWGLTFEGNAIPENHLFIGMQV